MTLNAATADQLASVSVEVSSERRDTLVFFAIVAALVATIVVTGLTFGLAGVGMIALAEAAAMLALCVALTVG